MDAKDPKYKYNRFGTKGARVGQAVYDMMKSGEPASTAGEVLDAYAPKFIKLLEEAVERGARHWQHPFCVMVLSRKEMLFPNVETHFFVDRQTIPDSFDMALQYPNWTKTAYKVTGDKVEILWSIPGDQDCIQVLKNPKLYDPELIRWIKECYEERKPVAV